jgi:hypothetical protein
VPGTPFALAYLDVPRSTSGPAIGALVAGLGSLAGSTLVGCFGALGTRHDVGALVGGAFAVSAGLLGAAGIVLGVLGLRQIRATGARGRGLAISGIICGAAGLTLTALAMIALLLA